MTSQKNKKANEYEKLSQEELRKLADERGLDVQTNNEESLRKALQESDVAKQIVKDDSAQPQVKAKLKRVPATPTDEERERHNQNHVPYRGWCQLCVMGKAVNDPHLKQTPHDANAVPVIQFDYAFPGKQGDRRGQGTGGKVTMLVAVDKRGGDTLTCYCRQKGSADKYALAALENFINELGH